MAALLAGNGVVPLRNSTANPALSGADPLASRPPASSAQSRPSPAGSLADIGAVEINQALSTAASAKNDVITGNGPPTPSTATCGND